MNNFYLLNIAPKDFYFRVIIKNKKYNIKTYYLNKYNKNIYKDEIIEICNKLNCKAYLYPIYRTIKDFHLARIASLADFNFEENENLEEYFSSKYFIAETKDKELYSYLLKNFSHDFSVENKNNYEIFFKNENVHKFKQFLAINGFDNKVTVLVNGAVLIYE